MVDTKHTSLQLKVNNINELQNAAREMVDFANQYKVWLLEGQMGAGKTTLTKAINSVFGVIDVVTSPTFSIVNQYQGKNREVYYHFDFYRIENEREAIDIGIDEYFYSGNYCFVEWSSNIPTLLPYRYLKVDIAIEDKNSRLIKCTKYG